MVLSIKMLVVWYLTVLSTQIVTLCLQSEDYDRDATNHDDIKTQKTVKTRLYFVNTRKTLREGLPIKSYTC